MAGMLRQLLEKELTDEQLIAIGGAARCEGAVTRSDLAYGAILAIVQGEPVPEAIERRISIEPAAKLEKERAESALEVLDDLLTLATRESGLKSLPINA